MNIVLCGLSSGLALLSKFTAPVLPPLLVVLLLIFFFTREFKGARRPWMLYAGGFIVAMSIAVLVLNMGYAFQNTLEPLSANAWRSGLLKSAAQSPLGRIPLPLPRLYLDAFDIQFLNKSRPLFTYYLNGELSHAGWPSYYWVALLLKTPVPLLLGSLAALIHAFRKDAAFRERALWGVPVLFMLTFTFFVRIDMGFRYLLPIVPFLIVSAAIAFKRFAARGGAAAAATALLCLWYASSIFTTFGNGLAYFNEFAGGPSGGHRYLVESNLDWGQNLLRLKQYSDEHPSRPLLVSYYGLVPPSVYGIEAGWLPCEPVRALVAVSVNHLKGIDLFQHRSKECFSWLAKRKPDAILGGGLFIYDTTKDDEIIF